ncbi:MAG: DUF2182 domain-containing protein [Trueperaceae bacterium]|nr:MAG: DUF2182 domain-containing protein [Trueperaceae bacterium]
MNWAATQDRFDLSLLLLLGLSGGAWLTLFAWGRSPYARYLSHEALVPASEPLLLGVYLAAWLLMLNAMMLPTTTPLVALFRRLTRRRAGSGWLVALLLAGYLAVWLAFSLALYVADVSLHRLAGLIPWLAENPWAPAASTLALAGVYQFTPLKHRCLERCRSPLSFITNHWHGKDYGKEALSLGFHHGLYCLGCCWTLMLVMFALGAANLGWMLALGAVMAAEKNSRWGRRLSTPVGLVLLAWAWLTVLRAGPWA